MSRIRNTDLTSTSTELVVLFMFTVPWCAECIKRPVDGFLLDGFHMNGPATESLPWDQIQAVLMDCLRLLPRDKPRFFFGAARPELVFRLVAAGIDVFDSTYPCLVTERDAALIFPNSEEVVAAEEGEQAESSSPAALEMSMNETVHRFAQDYSDHYKLKPHQKILYP
jgi:tRNA-guanine family transglycosylase